MGSVERDGDGSKVVFNEDQYIYQTEITQGTDSLNYPRFKPVNITTTEFCVQLINLGNQCAGSKIRLRWWAIPAQQLAPQKYTFPIIKLDLKCIFSGERTTLVVTNQDESADNVIVDLSITPIDVGGNRLENQKILLHSIT